MKEEEINVLYRTQDTFNGASIIITSYDSLSRVPAKFSKENFQIVIAVSENTCSIQSIILLPVYW